MSKLAGEAIVVKAVLLVAFLAVTADGPGRVRAAGPADAPAAVPGCPPAGKQDTFAQDTWLRRNKHPLQIKVTEAFARGGERLPITLSVACGEGDYPRGKLCPILDGQAVPAQVDVLATWPSDGSIKHALVSLVLPPIGKGVCKTYTFATSAPETPGPFVSKVDMRGLTFLTEFVNPDGTKTVTAIDPATVARIADVLDGKVVGDEAKKLAPRLAGPLCYEFEVKVPAKTGDAPDADIDVYYRLRLYSGLESVRVEYDVENSRLPAKPYPAGFAVHDRDFTDLVFQAGPAEKLETLYRQREANHWWATRYRVCQWWGKTPRLTFAKESAAYLIYSEFFPKIDIEHPMTGDEGLGEAEEVVASRWYRNPVDFPDGVPLSNGPLVPDMGRTGGRPEIGAYAMWDRLALASDSPTLAQYARIAHGNSLAAFPVHMRPADNGQPGVAYDEPIHRSQLAHVVSRNPCRNSPDSGHVPSNAYYTYLATGERFYEEEMAFWGAAMLGGGNILAGHNRYSAWPLRNATDAGFVLPDANPMKKYFNDYVQRMVEAAKEAVKDPASYWGVPSLVGVSSGMWCFWQHVFYVWALENASRKGHFPVAAEARDAAADLLIRLYLCDEEFKAPDGRVYRSRPEFAIPYLLAVSLNRSDFTDPKHVVTTPIKTITDNTGEMYYYTLVHMQYANLNAATAPDKLPKKIMAPEDWKLDPEFVKQQEQKQLEGMKRNVGYHDEANGPTSAALARYDNPRAQKMYDIVRGFMDAAYGKNPNRIRGVDYTK